jgi:molybdopterin/thiamine biosynthesis adenylyltransferase/rhodanese-related sulfurtransferase
MAVTFREILARAKQTVREITPDELSAQFGAENGSVVLDVREKDEHAQGVFPGAVLIPRGLLELKVESVIPDRNTPIAIYCAGGVRSALAAHSLQQMGYTNVSSVAGGFAKYAQEGLEVETRQTLTNDQSARYSRHLILPEVGESGQLKLLESKALFVGAGGLGSPSALYAAAAGIGTIGIVDSDTVDMSNLQRQILHTESRVGVPKTDSAEATLKALNSEVNVIKYRERITSENAMRILKGYDLVIDGCDNFPTRYLINDACVMLGLPNIHGSIFRFEGQATVFHPGKGPCYRCLYPQPPPPGMAPSCEEAGVLGVLPGVVGLIQAIEAIKVILNIGNSLAGRLVTFDALQMEFREMRLLRDPECPMCGDNPTITELIDYEEFCTPG